MQPLLVPGVSSCQSRERGTGEPKKGERCWKGAAQEEPPGGQGRTQDPGVVWNHEVLDMEDKKVPARKIQGIIS